ncbi:hypothetical protein HBN50_06935 [Halobacteriovorax sp. GB3]|uniref:hypothetical protein n=1 Tax=Halobacteriovorax sp. GB3 TaxID=2719615 RepID=UPI00235F67B3|nr:hypothetical protein [Halobacteriovorax sp. GB3]MDD0852822.1 hypothetical protein [Halobacteriovorax sp. GB3]
MKKALISIFTLCIANATMAKLDRNQTLKVMDHLFSIYEVEMQKNLPLRVELNWDSDKAQASIGQNDKEVHATVHGGLARLKYMSTDSLALILCHEIGHIIGGAPMVQPSRKYSSEAQSDYFANKTCFKRYMKSTSTESEMNLTPEEKRLCPEEDQACIRHLNAIKTESLSFKEAGLDYPTTLLTSSTHYASITLYNDYPDNVCRQETAIKGALDKERPICWYNSNEANMETGYIILKDAPEAQIVATVQDTKKWKHGCAYKVSFLELWNPSYFNPLSDREITQNYIHSYQTCKLSKGDTLSTVVTKVDERLYMNVESKDK